ncbi:hypothetical protein MCAMS1_01298 [biofilm metagenome]
MNKFSLTIIKIISVIVFCFFAFNRTEAATYYVNNANAKASDTNPGTQASPWKTIGKASTAMSAGDTAIVMAGTYKEILASTRSGTSANRIKFKASGNVNLQSANINHDYITVDGFNFNDGGVIDINTGNYCEILNNKLIPGWITMHYLDTADKPTGCLIKGNILKSHKSLDGDYVVIQIFGSKHIVENNEIGPSSDIDAFRLWGHDNIIRNNYAHDMTYSPNSKSHMDGFQIFGDNGWASYNQLIENNRFINSDGQLFMTSTDGVTGIHDIIVRNNVFARFNQNANIGIKNMSFLNNTFYDVGIFSGNKTTFGTSENATFKNNIFIGINGYNLTDYDANLFLSEGYTSTWVFQNNFFSTLNGAALKNFDSLTQAKAINGGTVNFTNIATNDFSIKPGSVTIDKGQTLTGFSYDLTGNPRPQGEAWDMGAYEYGANSVTTLLPPSNLRIPK